MNAPLPPFAASDHTSDVASRRIAQRAARRLRNAIKTVRGTKTSIGKARDWLGRCDADVELQLEIQKLVGVERRLVAIARRLENACYPDQDRAPAAAVAADLKEGKSP